MADTTMSNIHVRVPKADKELAIAKLKNSGMDLSTAVNIFIKQLIQQDKFPVEIYTEYQFPQTLYDSLDHAELNRSTTKYVPLDECFKRWENVISGVENDKI